MPARNQRKIQPNILIYLNMIMFFFLIQIWHIGRDHICYLGSRVSHIFHTVTGYLNKTWTSVNIQQIWTGSSHGFFCHMYLAHQRRSYGRQTPLFACISCILCGLNWFSFRTEKRSWKKPNWWRNATNIFFLLQKETVCSIRWQPL